ARAAPPASDSARCRRARTHVPRSSARRRRRAADRRSRVRATRSGCAVARPHRETSGTAARSRARARAPDHAALAPRACSPSLAEPRPPSIHRARGLAMCARRRRRSLLSVWGATGVSSQPTARSTPEPETNPSRCDSRGIPSVCSPRNGGEHKACEVVGARKSRSELFFVEVEPVLAQAQERIVVFFVFVLVLVVL